MTTRMLTWNLHVIFSCCFFVSSFLNTFASSSRRLCQVDQKDALIEFKNEFRLQKPEFVDPFGDRLIDFSSYPRTESWKNSSDCCYWDGVTCDAKSGEVIRLDLSFSCLTGPFKPNSSLFRLQHLRSLNLAQNNFSLSSIPAEFGQLHRLKRLNLSSSAFSGQIPTELLQLTRLVSLDLSSKSGSYRGLYTEESFLSELALNLTNLRDLHLSRVDISSTVPANFVNLSSLRSLHLGETNLLGKFPSGVFQLPHIQSISLIDNPNLIFTLPEFHTNSSLAMLDLSSATSSRSLPDSIGNLKLLSVLSLASCNFTGKIPFSLGNLSHLTSLDLSFNNFVGEVPSSVGNLNKLADLILSYNQLSGNFPLVLLNLTELSSIFLTRNHFAGPLPSDMSGLSKLIFFYVDQNSFVGTFPLSLFKIPTLIWVKLSENLLSGSLEFGNVSSSTKVSTLYLNDNNFDGLFPTSILKLVNLEVLDLSNLNLSGTVDLSIFSHLKSLYFLGLTGISVSIANVRSGSDSPLRLNILWLSACNISEFPKFLRNQRDLLSLDLSNNRIKGQVPEWLWRLPNLQDVNLAYNCFIGFEGSLDVLRATRIKLLDIRSNAFGGPFPAPPQSISHLFGSENNFTGKLPPSICKLNSLQILDLSNNRFSGSIRRCFGNFSNSLTVLNLRNNSLVGTLPRAFNKGNELRTLDISDNQLMGKLPKSLLNCTSLEVLNMESNRINGTFPFWLRTLPELQVLVLRSNAFYGPIHVPRVSFGFSKLRILDISRNDFVGTLPSDYFVNLTAMSLFKTKEDRSELKYMGDSKGYYQDSIVLMNKGLEMELVRILTIFTAIDFSGNKLEGNIPESIGLLNKMIVLNLSNNAFTGYIPPSLANLTELESLDLSRNRLSGTIPPELASLSSLSRINFSHNQLIGQIPQGTQFQTQDSSCFEGNLGLCGLPLEKSCGDINTPTTQQTQQLKSEEVVSWVAAAIGCAPGLVFGLTIGHIITSYKHEWFTKIFGRNRCRRTRN